MLKGTYKHSEETKKHLSEVHKGKIPWNNGNIQCPFCNEKFLIR